MNAEVICSYDAKSNEPVLYFISATDENSPLNLMYKFDKVRFHLEMLSHLNEGRNKFVYDTWADTIAVGGGSKLLKTAESIEIYKVSRNKWSKLEVHTPVNSMCYAQGKLFLFGIKDMSTSESKSPTVLKVDILNLVSYEWETSIGIQGEIVHNWGPFAISIESSGKIFLLGRPQETKCRSYCFNIAKNTLEAVNLKGWNEQTPKQVVWMKFPNGDVWAVPKSTNQDDYSYALRVDIKEKKLEQIALS